MSTLAIKITLPFVALFAALLLVLGLVLARDILSEVEARVEAEQEIVLKFTVCSAPGLDQDFLHSIRDKAQAARKTEFVILEENKPPLSTISPRNIAAWKTVEDLQQTIKAHPEVFKRGPQKSPQPTTPEAFQEISAPSPEASQQENDIQRRLMTLNGQKWLVLYTHPAKDLSRQFYLLYPYVEIEEAKNRALWRIIGWGGAGLVLAAVLGLAVARRIARPVQRLAATAKRISAGGLNEPLELGWPVKAGAPADEIAELMRAFKTMVESLRASQNELLKAERLAATGKLAASVAHEIRNPLTSLRMTLEMLQQRAAPADAGTQETYHILLGEIDRLALAVEELLTFARPHPPRLQPTDLNKLAGDTLKFLERQMAHAKIESAAELDPAMPKDLALDPHKIRQLLVNLLLNAQQAIVRDGQVRVKTAWDAGTKTARLSVADTGPGIPEEVRGNLFELFVTTKAGGGGLGLALAKQIAEEHGGSINFETSPKGTAFTAALPQKSSL